MEREANTSTRSAKTWSGITGYSHFIYRYFDANTNFVFVREQTNLLKSSKKMKNEKLLKLWPSYLASDCTNNRSHVNV